MRFFIVLLISLTSQTVFGEVTKRKMMEVVLDPTLYNGTKSVEGEFLMMGWIGNCTGTAVGPNTLFTASHCVTTGKKISYTPRFNGQKYGLTCTRHPQYNDRTVLNDWALCKLDFGTFPTDMPLASFEARTPEIGEQLLLNGYGAPTVTVHHWGPEKMDRQEGQDLVLCGSVYLGGGDSGGSLLAWSEDRSGKSGFKILGVNSRAGGGCSYFNAISDQRFWQFARSYETSNNVQICGVSAKCTGSTPPPSPEPTNCWKTYEELAFCVGTKGIPKCVAKAEQLLQCVK